MSSERGMLLFPDEDIGGVGRAAAIVVAFIPYVQAVFSCSNHTMVPSVRMSSSARGIPVEWWTNHNSSTFPCMRGPNTRRSFSILQTQAREVTALSRPTYLPTYLRCTCSIQPVWEVFSYPQQSSSLSCWELGIPRNQDGHLPHIPRQVRGHHLSWTHDCESSLIQYITCATIDATRCIRIVPVPHHALTHLS